MKNARLTEKCDKSNFYLFLILFIIQLLGGNNVMASNEINKIFRAYFSEICKLYKKNAGTGEFQFRTFFHNFLNAIKNDQGISIVQEPKRSCIFGAPDFIVKKIEAVTGYIETKECGKDLEKVLHSDQIKKYKELSQNILLTDYLNFFLIRNDEVTRICLGDVHGGFFARNVDLLQNLFSKFFNHTPRGCSSMQSLAKALRPTRSHPKGGDLADPNTPGGSKSWHFIQKLRLI